MGLNFGPSEQKKQWTWDESQSIYNTAKDVLGSPERTTEAVQRTLWGDPAAGKTGVLQNLAGRGFTSVNQPIVTGQTGEASTNAAIKQFGDTSKTLADLLGNATTAQNVWEKIQNQWAETSGTLPGGGPTLGATKAANDYNIALQKLGLESDKMSQDQWTQLLRGAGAFLGSSTGNSMLAWLLGPTLKTAGQTLKEWLFNNPSAIGLTTEQLNAMDPQINWDEAQAWVDNWMQQNPTLPTDWGSSWDELPDIIDSATAATDITNIPGWDTGNYYWDSIPFDQLTIPSTLDPATLTPEQNVMVAAVEGLNNGSLTDANVATFAKNLSSVEDTAFVNALETSIKAGMADKSVINMVTDLTPETIEKAQDLGITMTEVKAAVDEVGADYVNGLLANVDTSQIINETSTASIPNVTINDLLPSVIPNVTDILPTIENTLPNLGDVEAISGLLDPGSISAATADIVTTPADIAEVAKAGVDVAAPGVGAYLPALSLALKLAMSGGEISASDIPMTAFAAAQAASGLAASGAFGAAAAASMAPVFAALSAMAPFAGGIGILAAVTPMIDQAISPDRYVEWSANTAQWLKENPTELTETFRRMMDLVPGFTYDPNKTVAWNMFSPSGTLMGTSIWPEFRDSGDKNDYIVANALAQMGYGNFAAQWVQAMEAKAQQDLDATKTAGQAAFEQYKVYDPESGGYVMNWEGAWNDPVAMAYYRQYIEPSLSV